MLWPEQAISSWAYLSQIAAEIAKVGKGLPVYLYRDQSDTTWDLSPQFASSSPGEERRIYHAVTVTSPTPPGTSVRNLQAPHWEKKGGSTMQYHWILSGMGAIAFSAVFAAPALADPRAHLEGFEEVPIVSTTGEGRCSTRIRDKETPPTIEVELSYENLEGTVQQAHIHLAQRDVNGGIVLFLCSNLGNGPAGTPTCPGPHSGMVTRTLTSADVIPQTTQGIAAGEIDEVIDAMREGKSYCNVHTDMSPGGEIRGKFK